MRIHWVPVVSLGIPSETSLTFKVCVLISTVISTGTNPEVSSNLKFSMQFVQHHFHHCPKLLYLFCFRLPTSTWFLNDSLDNFRQRGLYKLEMMMWTDEKINGFLRCTSFVESCITVLTNWCLGKDSNMCNKPIFATSCQTILPRTVVIDPFSSDTIQLIRTWCRAFSLIGPIQQFSRNLFRNHTIQLACRRRPEKPKSCSVRPGKNEPPWLSSPAAAVNFWSNWRERSWFASVP